MLIATTAYVPGPPEAVMRHDPASAAIVIMLRSLKMYGPDLKMGLRPSLT